MENALTYKQRKLSIPYATSIIIIFYNMSHVSYTSAYHRPVRSITLFSLVCKQLSTSVNTLPIKKKVPLRVSANNRLQANYSIYVSGTKQRRVTQIPQSYNIFYNICGFKHIHTHDLSTALVFFTLHNDVSRHMNTLFTTDGEAHIKYSRQYKLPMHRLSTHKYSVINHSKMCAS